MIAIAATLSLVAPPPGAAGSADPAFAGALLSDSEPPDFDFEQLQTSAKRAIAHKWRARWRMGPPRKTSSKKASQRNKTARGRKEATLRCTGGTARPRRCRRRAAG